VLWVLNGDAGGEGWGAVELIVRIVGFSLKCRATRPGCGVLADYCSKSTAILPADALSFPVFPEQFHPYSSST
jgi:hypothetical protein